MDEVLAILCGIGSLVAVPMGLLFLMLTETRTQLTRTRRELKDLQHAVDLLKLHPPAPAPAPAPVPVPVAEAEPQPQPSSESPEPPEPEDTVEPAPVRELPVGDAIAPRPEPMLPKLPHLAPERVVVWIAAGLGGLAAVLAALFGLVAVVERGWIGPVARVSGAFVGGVGLWVAGALLGRRWPRAGSALAGAGIGTLYGAAWAGSGLYHLFGNTIASLAMIAVTVVGTFRAWRTDDRFVAWLALVGGLLTPILVSTGENRPYSLFAYLALLAAGMVAAAVRRGWAEVVVAAALGAAGLHAGWASEWYAADQVPAALFGSLALIAPFAAISATSRPWVRGGALFGVAVLVAVTIPWLGPVDSHFVDPRSGLWVASEALNSQPLVAGAALAILALVAAPTRRFDGLHHMVPIGLLTTALAVTATTPWVGSDQTAPGWMLLTAAGPGLLGMALAWGRPTYARVMAVAGLMGAALALPGTVEALGGAWLAAPLLLLLGLLAVAHRSTRWGWVWAAGLFGATAIEVASVAALADEPVRYTVGPALIALAALGQGAARARLESDGRVAWLVSALAGLASFPLLYRAWDLELGDSVIGALPLLLAAATLVSAVSIARRARLGRDDVVVAIFTLIVLLGVTAAVPLQLRERWLTVGWALEAAALAWLGRDLLRHPLIRGASLLLVAAVSVRLLANPWALSWGRADGWVLLNWTLYSWGLPALCIGYVAWSLPDDERDPWHLAKLPVGIAALLVGFGLVNVEVSHAFQRGGPLELDLFAGDRLQSMVRSAAWAGYGLAVLAGGLWRDSRVVRLIGFCFVLLATLKVFLVDLWDLSGFLRVGSLAALAVALIAAAFAFERLVLRGSGVFARKHVEET
ncbi:MAG: DUF2339 domain-containing protein [Myxococcales bacterium]|nr:DUF2339 domain-containing protein [Myxococcales bacterium]